MEPFVAAIVLLSAMMHAGWNALVKRGADGLVVQASVVAGGALLALPLLAAVPPPPPALWGYLIASAFIHGLYFWILAAAYRFGDLSLVYPIARGSGPLLVAALSAGFLGELLDGREIAGLVLICSGLFALALSGRRGGGMRAVLYATAVAVTIAGFTLCDGIGVRRGATPFTYIVWLIVVQSGPILAIAWWRRGSAFPRLAAREWRAGLAGGALVALSYGIAMWAFAKAELALVMALRETAVIFGALIGIVLFRESFGVWRILASVLVAAGAVVINLGT